MKKANVLILVLIAATIAVIVASFSDFSTYESFASAAEKPGTTFHVVGYLDSAKGLEYDPIKDPNRFVFYAKDKKDNIHKVIFSGAKPTDFEKSEQLVMKGYMKGNEFHCAQIQMKCPSKYENDQVVVGKQS